MMEDPIQNANGKVIGRFERNSEQNPYIQDYS